MDENIKVEVISERKLKYLRFKAKVREKVHAGWEWCVDNKEMLILLGTGAGAAINGISKLSSTRRTEEKRVEYYDPHTGEYTEVILEDMRVLK